MEPAVLYEVMGKTAWITMNQPKHLNTFTEELIAGLIDSFEQAEKDSQVRCAVLTGAGRAFSAGGNLDFLKALKTFDERRVFIGKVGQVVRLIHDLPKPVIAMVNGVAAGAGFNLAVACDMAYAAEEASFIQSFVKVGLAPDCGGFYYLAQQVGLMKAKELMMTARPVPAREALELQLVNGVFPAEQLRERVAERAEEISHAAPLALEIIKKMMNHRADTLDESLEAEAMVTPFLMDTEDFKEGVKAFYEKCSPHFTGR